MEEVNLEGARGILVIIAAGENLSMVAFAEVGDTIEEFASDDATVVVGTVIDPNLDEEMRVTVVATGLGSHHERPTKVVDNTETMATTDYRELDRPAIMRNRENAEYVSPMAKAGGPGADMDFLDIAVFLRRQAD